MQDAIDCPACGVNADTCRCALRWPHTSAMVSETRDAAAQRAYVDLLLRCSMGDEVAQAWVDAGWPLGAYRWMPERFALYDAFTRDAAGRLTLRTPTGGRP